MSGAAPRLVELHLVSDDDTAEIDPATTRQVPVRRPGHAAARFIVRHDAAFVTVDDLDDPHRARPERRGRQRLDDDHCRRVAALLVEARRLGEGSPRQTVVEQMHAELPTVDRWIREAKRRGYLRRDWSTTTEEAGR